MPRILRKFLLLRAPKLCETTLLLFRVRIFFL